MQRSPLVRQTANRRHVRKTWVGVAVGVILVGTILNPAKASAAGMADLGGLLDLTRPDLAAVAESLAANDEATAAAELALHYQTRTGIELPGPGGTGGDATADELAAGTFRFGSVTRSFGTDVDWNDLWGGTVEAPGAGQGLMRDFAFMGTLSSAYVQEPPESPKRAVYADAWMRISLDYFADNPTFDSSTELSTAKRLVQMVGSFSVFRTAADIDPDKLVAYLTGVHATATHLSDVLETRLGNNWYVSMARAVYVTAVYLPEFKSSLAWENRTVRAAERFLRRFTKGDGLYREPAVNYQAYVAELLNYMVEVGGLNGRTLPRSITRAADWIADALFATRQPNLQAALIGDSSDPGAGRQAIASAGARNSWDDFTWVGSGGTNGSVPTQPSTLFPLSYAVQRSGWDPDARYMLINNQDSTYTASHRHPDDLSLVMAAYGRPLIVDPGVGDYSSTSVNDWMRRTTAAHNTVEVDGNPQQPNTSANRVARSTSLWRTNAGLDVYRGITRGYKPVTHDRVVYFVKPGYWIVSDSLTGDTASHDYRQLWHFPGDAVTVDPTTQVASVGFGSVSGVRLVPVAAAGVSLTPEVHHDGAVRVGSSVLTNVDYLSYDWPATGDSGLDTIVIPGLAGSAPSVAATRIDMPSVGHSVATAMQIALPGASGRFYLSREQVPTTRSFGTATTDAETAYIERTTADNNLTRYALTRGSSLVDDGVTLVDASGTVSDLDVGLEGATARVSIADPFTGSVTINAPKASTVEVNGTPTAFSRVPGTDLITVSVLAASDAAPILSEDFGGSLQSTFYDFDASLQGWHPVQGSWALAGSDPDKQLTQTSTADVESFAMQPNAPDDVVVTAQVVPGARSQTTARTGIAVRYHDAGQHYRAEVLNTTGVAKLRIVKRVSGTTTVLAETDLPITGNAPHTLTVSAVGNRISASIADISISATDTDFPTGGVAAFTHRRAATFDDIVVTEALDQSNWQALAGDVTVTSGTLSLRPVSAWAHVLAHTTVPARLSQPCDFSAAASITIDGAVGNAGIALRDTGDAYAYRIGIGKTNRGTQYANIVRVAHASGATAAPVVIGSVSLANPLTGPVTLGAEIHGDQIRVTLNGVQVLEGRDTVIRSGGVGLFSTTDTTFDDLTVSGSC